MQGGGYFQRVLSVDATLVRHMTRKDASRQRSLAQLLERKLTKFAMVALANKTARIAWVVMARKKV